MKFKNYYTICFCAALLSFGGVGQSYAQDLDSLESIFEDTNEAEEAQPEEIEVLPPDDSVMPDVTSSEPEVDPFEEFRREMGLVDDGSSTAGADLSLSDPIDTEASPEDLEAEIRQEAFNAAVNGFLPLKPEEIRRFLEIYDEVKQASNTRIYPYPKPESKVVTVSLDPNDSPEVIKMAAGLVTTVTILDATGAPWPVGTMAWAGDFEVVEPDEGSNTFAITPLSEYAYGNLSLNFSGLSAPVIFTLATQREVAHVRFDARIPDLGPFAKPSIIGQPSGPSIQAGSATVVSVLDGAVPSEASMMETTGTDGRTRAYQLNGKVYLRTPLALISPAWSESATSADGTNVYVLDNTPVVLLSEGGKVVRVFIKDKENNL